MNRILILLITIFPSVVFADELDTGDTAWILVSTALVLFMTLPGLALFYSGLVRAKNVLSVLMQCFAIACLVSILWLVFAYGLAFGDGGSLNQIVGLGNLMISDVGMDSMSGTIPEIVFFMFQMTFAIITPALIIGGFAERMKFSSVLLFTALWLTLVYAPVCHWVWGGGWLADKGFVGEGEVPEIPDEIKAETARRYIEAFELITGQTFEAEVGDVNERLEKNLSKYFNVNHHEDSIYSRV